MQITSKMVVDLEKDAKAVDEGSTGGLPLGLTISKLAQSIYHPELYDNHEVLPNNCECDGFAE